MASWVSQSQTFFWGITPSTFYPTLEGERQIILMEVIQSQGALPIVGMGLVLGTEGILETGGGLPQSMHKEILGFFKPPNSTIMGKSFPFPAGWWFQPL